MILLFVISCILMNLQARKLAVKEHCIGTGMRVAHISDLHFDKILVNPSKLISILCCGEPDVIVITGDLCSKLKHFCRVTSFLDMLSCKASCPIFITLGNHDRRIFHASMIEDLENISPNIHVLENKMFIYKNVLFGGLTDVHSNEDNYGGLAVKWNRIAEENGYGYILLTHNPDIVIDMPKLSSLTVMLAGHTHGGQVRVPFNIEFTVLKKDILPKKGIYYGLHDYNGMKLYITSGIGCSAMPIRLRSKAEVVFFE